MREARTHRKTLETDIDMTLRLEGAQEFAFSSGIGFFDHMLSALSKHSGISIAGKCSGDLFVDNHHTIEDVGIVFGLVLRAALDKGKAFSRYGHAYVPMDEALVFCALDISSRPFIVYDADAGESMQVYEEFFRAFAANAGITLHIQARYGRNGHHIIESVFKSVGRALREAIVEIEGDPFTTKGLL